MSPSEIDELLDSFEEDELEEVPYLWELEARPEQLLPEGEWNGWLICAGRGYGKTRSGAEAVKRFGLENPGSRIAIVAETFGDGRDVCIEGESGLLSVLPPWEVKAWNRSLGELLLHNGTRYKLFSGDRPDQLRGPQCHFAWCDELAKWRYPEAWDQLMFGLRLGENPRVIVTTTPRPTKIVRDLISRDDVKVTTGSTFDNAANLSAVTLAQLKRQYEGTRLGDQELYAKILSEIPGALWQRSMFERVNAAPGMSRLVVGVDPATTSGEDSDLTGLVVAGLGEDGRGYVLYSTGVRLSPDGWAKRAVNLYHEYEADKIIAESNQGGQMVSSVIGTQDRRVPVKLVHASRGKRTRAEPVAALYEQGNVIHVGSHDMLEDQMCSYTGAPGEDSPDVLDSAVWALTELMLEKKKTPTLTFA